MIQEHTNSQLADGLVRVTDAAKYLAVSRGHVYRMMDSGKLAWVQLGDARRIAMRSVVEYVNKNYHPQQKGNG